MGHHLVAIAAMETSWGDFGPPVPKQLLWWPKESARIGGTRLRTVMMKSPEGSPIACPPNITSEGSGSVPHDLKIHQTPAFLWSTQGPQDWDDFIRRRWKTAQSNVTISTIWVELHYDTWNVELREAATSFTQVYLIHSNTLNCPKP